jgi:hypothetical protein
MTEANSEQQTDSNGGGVPLAPPAIYDTDVEQKMRFHTERRGVMYPVAHIFGSEALKDESILEYERARDQRLTDADVAEADDANAVALTNQSYNAALKFSEKYCLRKEGYAGKSSAKDNAFAVQNLLLGAEFEELPIATADQVCPEDDDDTSTYRLRCLSPEGVLMTTEHVMRPANSDEISEAQVLLSRTLLVQGTKFGQRDQRIPSKAKRWAELYDLMKVSTSRYARKIPLHHKVQVAQRHLKSEQKAITGN